jgi:hypothetical protein
MAPNMITGRRFQHPASIPYATLWRKKVLGPSSGLTRRRELRFALVGALFEKA